MVNWGRRRPSLRFGAGWESGVSMGLASAWVLRVSLDLVNLRLIDDTAYYPFIINSRHIYTIYLRLMSRGTIRRRCFVTTTQPSSPALLP